MHYDIIFLHPPSLYDFRKKPWFPGQVAGTVHYTPVFEGIPIGVLSMAEYVERHSYKTRIFNLAENMITDAKFDSDEFIKNLDADFFGIDLHFCVHSQGAIEIAKLVNKYHKNSSIVFGGLTATVFSSELLVNYPFIDYVIEGEGEKPILKLLDSKYSKDKIPNLIFRNKNGKIQDNELKWTVQNFDDLDFTRLDLVSPKYLLTTIDNKVKPIKHWMVPVCRGCLYNCVTCGGSKYSYSTLLQRTRPSFRSKEKIVEDLQNLSRQGIESIFLYMDMRMGGENYWRNLIKELSVNDTGIKSITFELFSPAEKSFLSQIANLNDSIKVGLTISPESGNENVRKAHGRYFNNESLINTAKFCKKSSIPLSVFFMFGLAHETEKSLNDTFDLTIKLAELNFEDRVGSEIKPQFGKMLLLDPGSLAFNYPKKYGYRLIFKNFKDYITNLSSPAWSDWLSYETEKMTRKELLELPMQFYDRIFNVYHLKKWITNEAWELALKKSKIDKMLLQELNSISMLKKIEQKEKRYWLLFNALENYGRGDLSLSWKLRKALNILDLF